MTNNELREVTKFILSHHETYDGKTPFTLTSVDPNTWWSKVQLAPHNPEKLFPRSKEHFENRVRRWQELVIERYGE